MKYHVAFIVLCCAVALGVDYERQATEQGLEFGDLEVVDYVSDYAPRMASWAEADMPITDVVQLRGALPVLAEE